MGPKEGGLLGFSAGLGLKFTWARTGLGVLPGSLWQDQIGAVKKGNSVDVTQLPIMCQAVY